MNADKEHFHNLISRLAKQWEEEKMAFEASIRQLEEENRYLSELIGIIKKNVIKRYLAIEELEALKKEEIERELKYLLEEAAQRINIMSQDKRLLGLKDELDNLQKRAEQAAKEMKKYIQAREKALQFNLRCQEMIAERDALFYEIGLLEKAIKHSEIEAEELFSTYYLGRPALEDYKHKFSLLKNEIDELQIQKIANEKKLEQVKIEYEKERMQIELFKQEMGEITDTRQNERIHRLKQRIDKLNNEITARREEKLLLEYEIGLIRLKRQEEG